MRIWFAVLLVLLILILYIRKENLEASKDTKDSKDPKDSKDSKDTKDSKDPKDGKETKDGKDTTIIIVGDQDRPYPRFADPFYTMTDPYWSAYNYRPFGYGYFGRPHVGYHSGGHRRIW